MSFAHAGHAVAGTPNQYFREKHVRAKDRKGRVERKSAHEFTAREVARIEEEVREAQRKRRNKLKTEVVTHWPGEPPRWYDRTLKRIEGELSQVGRYITSGRALEFTVKDAAGYTHKLKLLIEWSRPRRKRAH